MELTFRELIGTWANWGKCSNWALKMFSNGATALLSSVVFFWISTGKFQEEPDQPAARFLRVSHTMDGDMTSSESVKFDWPRCVLLPKPFSNESFHIGQSFIRVYFLWAGLCWRWTLRRSTPSLSVWQLRMTRGLRIILLRRKRRKGLLIHWRMCVTLGNQSHHHFLHVGSCMRMRRWVTAKRQHSSETRCTMIVLCVVSLNFLCAEVQSGKTPQTFNYTITKYWQHWSILPSALRLASDVDVFKYLWPMHHYIVWRDAKKRHEHCFAFLTCWQSRLWSAHVSKFCFLFLNSRWSFLVMLVRWQSSRKKPWTTLASSLSCVSPMCNWCCPARPFMKNYTTGTDFIQLH